MTRNESLLTELNNSLENIKNIISTASRSFYDTELNELMTFIQHALHAPRRSVIFEKTAVIKLMMKIINQINEDIAGMELEMHGVANYSAYESKRTDDAAIKLHIKEELNKMLKMVVSVRPEIRNSELSRLIKRLIDQPLS